MNAAHIHLMINHFPIIGISIATSVLLYALVRQKPEHIRLGLWLMLLASISTLPAYFSGEGAEEVVENMPGIAESLIERHEEWAEITLIASQITGLLALASLIMTKKSAYYLKMGGFATVVSAAGAFVVMVLTANTGGKISHPELRNGEATMHRKSDLHLKYEDDDE